MATSGNYSLPKRKDKVAQHYELNESYGKKTGTLKSKKDLSDENKPTSKRTAHAQVNQEDVIKKFPTQSLEIGAVASRKTGSPNYDRRPEKKNRKRHFSPSESSPIRAMEETDLSKSQDTKHDRRPPPQSHELGATNTRKTSSPKHVRRPEKKNRKRLRSPSKSSHIRAMEETDLNRSQDPRHDRRLEKNTKEGHISSSSESSSSEETDETDSSKSQIPLPAEKPKREQGWRGLRAAAQDFLGVGDPYVLRIWQLAFKQKMQKGDVGLSLNMACQCIEIFSKKTNLNDADSPDSFTKVGEEREQEVSNDFTTGVGAFVYYLDLYKRDDEATEQKIIEDMTEVVPFIPKYRPWFTLFITVVQIIYLIISLTCYGIGEIGVGQRMQVLQIEDSLTNKGNVTSWVFKNPWIGPSIWGLIKMGAMFGPCMREDLALSKYLLDNEAHSGSPLGCCYLSDEMSFGTTRSDCINNYFRGKWVLDKCPKRSNRVSEMFPCCVGVLGACKVSSVRECQLTEGTVVYSQVSCRSVNCFKERCGGAGIVSNEHAEFLNKGTSQHWRVLVAGLFLPSGLILEVFFLIIQWPLVGNVERMCGWTRVLFVYVVSASAGSLAGSYFDPYHPVQGYSPALCGFWTVALYEVIAGGVRFCKMQLFVMMVCLLTIFVMGLWPLFSNWAHLAGCFAGFLAACIVMPHLCFNIWKAERRAIVAATAFGCLLTFFLVLCVLFYHVQNLHVCPGCQYFDCVVSPDNACDIPK